MDKQENLKALRHSCEHVLTMAMLRLWGNKIKAAMGPATDEGFYFDFDTDLKISEQDFEKIEKEMAKIIKEDLPIIKDEFTTSEANDFFSKNIYKGNEYKHEWLDQIKSRGEKVCVYWMGEKGKDIPDTFVDICSGPHVKSTGEIGPFKLLSVAGAYWHGNEKNKMLTRIYGTCFPSKEELDTYLNMLEEAKKRDHRKLGKELDLFIFSDLVGPGLPLFTPKGTILREELFKFSESLQLANGYQKVWIPHITKTDLYKKSGHWDKFGDELFLVKSQETSDQLVLKPMNCPHHVQIYASKKRSYKELPIRYMETTTQYRDEKMGELLGLSRVRSISIDDSHVFCTMEQIEEEFRKIMDMVRTMYKALGMEFRSRLSFRDSSDKFLGELKDWEQAQQILEKVAKDLNINYFVAEGEAAFYGPKIDILVTDSLGREWQCATEQLDFVQPQRFGLTYTDKDGSEKMPFMIHKALLGSIERFLSVYIEHTAGAFPVWLSPVQVQIIPIADRHQDYAQKVLEQLNASNIRVEIDNRQETMQSKIRYAQTQKIPYMLIVGDREEKDNKVAVRLRSGQDLGAMAVEQLLTKIKSEIESKS